MPLRVEVMALVLTSRCNRAEHLPGWCHFAWAFRPGHRRTVVDVKLVEDVDLESGVATDSLLDCYFVRRPNFVCNLPPAK